MLILVIDLILLKRGVYRHLLYNRGSEPRKAAGGTQKAEGSNTGDGKQDKDAKENNRLIADRHREKVSMRLFQDFYRRAR
jgi:hypothetical protein